MARTRAGTYPSKPLHVPFPFSVEEELLKTWWGNEREGHDESGHLLVESHFHIPSPLILTESLPHLPRSHHNPLEAGELLGSHGTTRMQSIGGDPDLRTQPVLTAVCQTRGAVPHH